MGSFGERLRREREMRGVSLDDIAVATKIGTRLLRALEEENFELLPGGIFNKGFVRAYAKYLGMNEEEAVADYLQAAGESNPDPRVIAEQNSGRIDRATANDAEESGMAGFPLIPVLVLLVVIAAGWGGWKLYQERLSHRQAKVDKPTESLPVAPATNTPSDARDTNPVPPTAANGGTVPTGNIPQTPSAKTATGVESTATTTGTSSLDSKATPAGSSTQAGIPDSTKTPAPAKASDAEKAPGGQPFEVAVRAKDRAWISIKSDGKFVVQGIISPADVKTVHATDEVIFYTGNAGAVEVSFNGQRIALAGGPNSKGVLVFNSHGVVIPSPATPTHEP